MHLYMKLRTIMFCETYFQAVTYLRYGGYGICPGRTLKEQMSSFC